MSPMITFGAPWNFQTNHEPQCYVVMSTQLKQHEWAKQEIFLSNSDEKKFKYYPIN